MFIQVSQNLFGTQLTAGSPGIFATEGNLTPNSLYFGGNIWKLSFRIGGITSCGHVRSLQFNTIKGHFYISRRTIELGGFQGPEGMICVCNDPAAVLML